MTVGLGPESTDLAWPRQTLAAGHPSPDENSRWIVTERGARPARVVAYRYCSETSWNVGAYAAGGALRFDRPPRLFSFTPSQSMPVPVQPSPPEAPVTQVIVGSGDPPPELIMAILGILVGGLLLWPLVRAWARRLERGSADPALKEEVEHLRARLAEMDGLQDRVAELEERADFAERMLTQGTPEPPGRQLG